jgi:WD40 repeat protein
MSSSHDRQLPDPTPPGETVFLQAHASGDAVIYQARGDQHVHFEDGVRRRQRSEPGEVLSNCPYPGLAAFGIEQARWFFGRDELIAALIDDLDRRLSTGGLQIVVAPSGAGKSSLLRAGLLPKLRYAALPGSDQWPIALFTPTAEPMRAFAEQLALLVGTDPAQIAQDLAVDPDGCISLLHETLRRRVQLPPADVRLVVVVDQFEELFTVCIDDQQRQRFINLLAKLAAPGSGAQPLALVVVGVRADFYAACVNFPLLRVALQDWPLVVGPMSEAQLREAILYPARDVGLKIEQGLVEMLLRDLGATTTGDSEATSYEAERLPLLAHALRACWQQRDGATLTVDGYQTTGGIQRAIAVTADRAYNSLDIQAQQVAKALFLRLVKIGDNTEDTRRRLTRAELVYTRADPRTATAILEAFTDVRLLTQRQDTVEITHEAMLRGWPLLRRWIDTNRASQLIHQDLEDAAAAWNHTRDTAQLYRGSRLETAQGLATGPPDAHLSSVAHAFLAASTRQRRRGRRLRISSIAGLAILSIAALTGALIAGINAAEANKQRNTAVEQQQLALSRQLTAQAAFLKEANPPASAQLTVAAWRISNNPTTRNALLGTQGSPIAGRLSGLSGNTYGISFSPAGNIVATTGADHKTMLWDLQHRQLQGIPLPSGNNGYTFAPTFSRDGHLFAYAAWDGNVRFWDMQRGRPYGNPISLGRSGTSFTASLSPAGDVLAATNGTNIVQLWDVTTGRPRPQTLTGHTAPITAVVFSTDGAIIATASSGDHTVRLWATTSGKQLGPPLLADAGARPPHSPLAFSPDSKLLATAKSENGTVQLWNTTTYQPIGEPITTSATHVNAITFSPNGRTLATANQDGTVHLWDAATHLHVADTLTGHGDVANAVAFSPDGFTLGVAGGTGHVLLWDLSRPVIRGHTGAVNDVTISPDGNFIATAGADTTVRLWSTASRQQVSEPITAHSKAVTTVRFSPSGTVLATGSQDGTVRVWDLAVEPGSRISWKSRGEPISATANAVAFSPDGTKLAATRTNVVWLWNITEKVPTGTALPETADKGTISDLAFGPNGRTLATASFQIYLWDVAAAKPRGRPLSSTQPNAGWSNAVAFNVDNQALAAAGSDNSIRLWSATTGQSLGEPLLGHTDSIAALAFSPDGQQIVSAGKDSTIRLWDWKHEKPPLVISGSAPQLSVAYGKENNILASSDADGRVTLWGTDPAEVARNICMTAGAQLTENEWHSINPDVPYTVSCP